jgi:hypothetical protein
MLIEDNEGKRQLGRAKSRLKLSYIDILLKPVQNPHKTPLS